MHFFSIPFSSSSSSCFFVRQPLRSAPLRSGNLGAAQRLPWPQHQGPRSCPLSTPLSPCLPSSPTSLLRLCPRTCTYRRLCSLRQASGSRHPRTPDRRDLPKRPARKAPPPCNQGLLPLFFSPPNQGAFLTHPIPNHASRLLHRHLPIPSASSPSFGHFFLSFQSHLETGSQDVSSAKRSPDRTLHFAALDLPFPCDCLPTVFRLPFDCLSTAFQLPHLPHPSFSRRRASSRCLSCPAPRFGTPVRHASPRHPPPPFSPGSISGLSNVVRSVTNASSRAPRTLRRARQSSTLLSRFRRFVRFSTSFRRLCAYRQSPLFPTIPSMVMMPSLSRPPLLRIARRLALVCHLPKRWALVLGFFPSFFFSRLPAGRLWQPNPHPLHRIPPTPHPHLNPYASLPS